MTVSTTTTQLLFTANGVATTFALAGLTYRDPSHLVVESRVPPAAFAVVASGYSVSSVGIVFTTAPANGTEIRVRRVTPPVQPDTFPRALPTNTALLEGRLDALTLIAQENRARADDALLRPILVPEGDTAPSRVLPTVASRAGKIAGYDSQGSPTVVAVTAGTAIFYAQWCGVATGTPDAIVLTPPVAHPTAPGSAFLFRTSGANTIVGVTVDLPDLAPTVLRRPDGSALQVGDLPADALLTAVYDGTVFRLATLVSAISAATESTAGVAQRATQVLTDAATNDTDFITPLKLGRAAKRIVEQAGTFTIAAGDQNRLFIATTGSWPLNLPAPVAGLAGFEFDLLVTSTGAITLTPASGTIDGQATKIIPHKFSCTVFCTGTEWLTSGLPEKVAYQSLVMGSALSSQAFALPCEHVNYEIEFTNLQCSAAATLALRTGVAGIGGAFANGGADYYRNFIFSDASTVVGSTSSGNGWALTSTVVANTQINGLLHIVPGSSTLPAMLRPSTVLFSEATLVIRTLLVGGTRAANGLINAVQFVPGSGNINGGSEFIVRGVRRK